MTPEYENAIAKYYNKLRIIPLPLISWNVFSSWKNEISIFNFIQKNWSSREDFEKIVSQSKKTILVTNVDFEIIFSSENIFEMNGYKSFEIIGKSPKFFQGNLTSSETTDRIRIATSQRKPFKEIILNYKKDGSTYLCEIEAYPKFTKKGEFINYIAFEKIAS
jgi:PAS domain S-box-containing protein